jgi:hypothetical protein
MKSISWPTALVMVAPWLVVLGYALTKQPVPEWLIGSGGGVAVGGLFPQMIGVKSDAS